MVECPRANNQANNPFMPKDVRVRCFYISALHVLWKSTSEMKRYRKYHMRHLDGTHGVSCGLLLQLIISHGPIQSVLSLICIHFFGGLSFSCYHRLLISLIGHAGTNTICQKWLPRGPFHFT